MDSRVSVQGVELDLSGLQISPGLINAHDHLHFALFPRLGNGPYANATAWAREIYHPDREPVRSHLAVPKHLRLLWGGLRNLLAGVTTVCHHDEYHPVFDADFPVRVIKHYGWAHSLEFTEDVRARLENTPPDAPFLIHIAEGTDSGAAAEIFRLHELGALTDRTVLVHAVGITRDGWDLVKRTGASVIWCPRSNLFTLGRTIEPPAGVQVALGTDSPITTEGDLLDEIQFARSRASNACDLVTTAARDILRLPAEPDDWIAAQKFGAQPELVVIGGHIRSISPCLAPQLTADLREQFHPLRIARREPMLVRWNIPRLLEETRACLPRISLAGREVLDA